MAECVGELLKGESRWNQMFGGRKQAKPRDEDDHHDHHTIPLLVGLSFILL
jgi:hypothetical protein